MHSVFSVLGNMSFYNLSFMFHLSWLENYVCYLYMYLALSYHDNGPEP